MNHMLDHGPEAWVRAWARYVWRTALIVGIIVGTVYVLGRLKPVIISIFVASVLAYVIRPIAVWLSFQGWFARLHNSLATAIAAPARVLVRAVRRGRPGPSKRAGVPLHGLRLVATIYVVILMFVAMYAGVRIIINPFIEEAKNLAANFPRLQAQLQKRSDDVKDWYTANVPPKTRQWIEQQLNKSGSGDQFNLQTKVTEWSQAALRTVGGALKYIVEIVLLPVLAFYFALDSKRIKHEFASLLPSRRRKEALRMIHVFNQIMYSYVVGQAILCVLAGVIVGTFLGLLGMRYYVTLGVLAGITRAIPIIGPIIGGIPIVLLALIAPGGGVGMALAVLAFFTFMHFAESKFLMPLVIGDRMRLHPVIIIVVLLIGEEFGGLLGMFFAPPIAAIIRVALRRYWLGRSHRPAAPPTPPLRLDRIPETVD